MADDIKYFDILIPPEKIKLETYMKVYDAFCKAYKIESDHLDRLGFMNEINQNIYLKIKYGKSSEKGKEGKIYISGRHNVRSVEHKPQLVGNKLGARLSVIPMHSRYVRFLAYSYDKDHDYVGEFIKLAGKSTPIKYGKNNATQIDNLESKLK
jgi:hypothetical protein